MRGAVGRADLALLLTTRPGEAMETAGLIGFEAPRRRLSEPVAALPPEFPRALKKRSLARFDRPPGIVRDASPIPFLRLERMSFTDSPEGDQNVHSLPLPVNDDDLAGRGKPLFSLQKAAPLAPWPRLWPLLRRMLGASSHGRDLNIAALVGALSRGETVSRIPRKTRKGWSADVSLWVDRSPRLLPFWDDQDDVYRRLLAACGPAGVHLRLLDARTRAWSHSRRGDFLAGFRGDNSTTVLVLGDLGIYGSTEERATWMRTASRLKGRGIRVRGLAPCPRERWDKPLAAAWCAEPWERGRHSESQVARAEEETWEVRSERLLRLLSPALLVQPGLLRAIRRLLPASEADASTEVDAWRRAEVRAADATGLVLHPEAATRLRAEFAKSVEPSLMVRLRDEIHRWHSELPPELLHAEHRIWRGLVPADVAPSPGNQEAARAFEMRLEGAARRRLADPKRAATVKRYAQAALAAMPAESYVRGEDGESLRYAWGLAFEGVEGARPPPGFDRSVHGGGGVATPDVTHWGVRQVSGQLVFSASTGAWPSEDRGPGSPVAWLETAGPDIDVFRGDDPCPLQFVLRQGLALDLAHGEALTLQTDRCRVLLAWWTREEWASAAGRDCFGLWADVRVEDVVQRFRWIPPGRFWMGAPESEVGRYDDEGPRHRVAWTHGSWLADTPVTQALWSAVMREAPSRFEGPDRPVEQVSWEECGRFSNVLRERVASLAPRLPSEREWEHACRAGTLTATWVGDLDISDGNAPQLDPIAWYSGNSKGETHPVSQKQANPFGLFDMLGNVLEWCSDKSTPYDALEARDPEPKNVGWGRVIRGGNWDSQATQVRAAYRAWLVPNGWNGLLGLRLARGHRSSLHPAPAAEPRARGASPEPGESRAPTEDLRPKSKP